MHPASGQHQTRANSAQGRNRPGWQIGPYAHCDRCNEEGHAVADCPLIRFGLFFCYRCRAHVNHKGDNPQCPNYPRTDSGGGSGYANSRFNNSKGSEKDDDGQLGQLFRRNTIGRGQRGNYLNRGNKGKGKL